MRRSVSLLLLLLAAHGAACTLPDDGEADTGTASQAMAGTIITIPASALDRPERVYVLPVLYLPKDHAHLAADRTIAQRNLLIHLRIAQEKYRWMLRRPGSAGTAGFRGTFEIATWDSTAKVARVFEEGTNMLYPLVVASPKNYWELPLGVLRDPAMLGEIMNKLGCHPQSCPFVMPIVIDHPLALADWIGGRPFGYGFNGGGGFIRFPFEPVLDAAPALQSTMLHELGHAFGLMHTADAYFQGSSIHLAPPACQDTGGNPYEFDYNCPLSNYPPYCNALTAQQRRYAFHCSPSVMSYSRLNQTIGCPDSDGDGACEEPASYELTAALQAGALIGENKRNLAINALVFPELAATFDPAFDAEDPSSPLLFHLGMSYPDSAADQVPGRSMFRLYSNEGFPDGTTLNGFTLVPRAAIGAHTKSIPRVQTPFDARLMWRTRSLAAGERANLIAAFPEPINLGRVRAFTASDGTVGRAETMVVQKATPAGYITCGSVDFDGEHTAEALVSAAGDCAGAVTHYRFRFTTAAPHLTVRGLRLFDVTGRELFPPREPIARTIDTHPSTYWTPVQQIAPSTETPILGFAAPWDPDRMWHSRQVTPNTWVSISVALPDEALVSGVIVYAGHSGQYHRPNLISVQQLMANGAFQEIASAPGEATGTTPIYFTAARMMHLRISMRAPTGYVVVRGIRIVSPGGELFPPRWVAP